MPSGKDTKKVGDAVMSDPVSTHPIFTDTNHPNYLSDRQRRLLGEMMATAKAIKEQDGWRERKRKRERVELGTLVIPVGQQPVEYRYKLFYASHWGFISPVFEGGSCNGSGRQIVKALCDNSYFEPSFPLEESSIEERIAFVLQKDREYVESCRRWPF